MRLIDADALINRIVFHSDLPGDQKETFEDEINAEPPAPPQYEELAPEEAASEIASGSIMSAWCWLDIIIQLKQMGYAVCRKR